MEYNSPLVGILLANLVLIGTNFIGRCISTTMHFYLQLDVSLVLFILVD